MSLLTVDNLTKRFGGVTALQNVSFNVEEGEIFGVMGANGAGKTTLFSVIAGNETPSTGQITFRGERIDRKRPDRICRRGIARTYQIVRPFAGMTVLENVMVGALFGAARERSGARARARALSILDAVGLQDRAQDPASALTLAGCKRLEVARALATGPRLLMLDEVLAGLTATEVAEALDMIRKLHREENLTLLVIEHVMGALMELCDRILVLHHGERIAEDRPQIVADDPAVIEAYLGTEQ